MPPLKNHFGNNSKKKFNLGRKKERKKEKEREKRGRKEGRKGGKGREGGRKKEETKRSTNQIGDLVEKIVIYLFLLIDVPGETESCQIASFRQLEVTVGNRSMYGSKSRKA